MGLIGSRDTPDTGAGQLVPVLSDRAGVLFLLVRRKVFIVLRTKKILIRSCVMDKVARSLHIVLTY